MASLRTPFKWGIFLSSYIPLFLILALKHYSVKVVFPTRLFGHHLSQYAGLKIPALTIFWLILSVIAYWLLKLVFRVRLAREPIPKKITRVSSRNDAVTNYLLVYIFPFVVLDYTQVVNWIAFIAIFIVIGIIQVRSSHLYVNPVLGLKGYNIYEAETADERMLLLTPQRIHGETSISAVELSRGVYIEV